MHGGNVRHLGQSATRTATAGRIFEARFAGPSVARIDAPNVAAEDHDHVAPRDRVGPVQALEGGAVPVQQIGRDHREHRADQDAFRSDEGALGHERSLHRLGPEPERAQHADRAPALANGTHHHDAEAGDADQQAEREEALHQPEEALARREVLLDGTGGSTSRRGRRPGTVPCSSVTRAVSSTPGASSMKLVGARVVDIRARRPWRS